MAQSLVKKMLIVPEDVTKEQVAGEIDKVMNDPTLKDVLSKLHIDRPAYVGGAGRREQTSGSLLVARKVTI